MNAPARQILLQVDERVFTHLSKMAGELGRSPTRYALELFEAAYAVRCGVAADASLAAAIKNGPEQAALSASADELTRLRAKADRVPKLESTVLRLRSDLAASQQHVRRLAAEQPKAPGPDDPAYTGRVAAAERHAAQMAEERREIAEKLEQVGREYADNLKAASEALELKQAEAAQLRRELAEAHANNELLDSLEKSANARAVAAETARLAGPTTPSIEPDAPLERAIADLKAAVSDLRDVVGDQKLQSDQLDQLYRRTREALEARRTTAAAPPDPTPLAQPDAAPVTKTPPVVPAKTPKATRAERAKADFIWKKSWGQGR